MKRLKPYYFKGRKNSKDIYNLSFTIIMYIKRKTYSIFQDEDGVERLYS